MYVLIDLIINYFLQSAICYLLIYYYIFTIIIGINNGEIVIASEGLRFHVESKG